MTQERAAHTGGLVVKSPKPARYPAYTIESAAGEVLATVPITASGNSHKLALVMAASPILLGVVERLAQEVEFGGSSATAIRAMLQDAHAVMQKATGAA